MTRSIFIGREHILTEEGVRILDHVETFAASRQTFVMNLESELLDNYDPSIGIEGEKAVNTALRALIRFIKRSIRGPEALLLSAVAGTNVLVTCAGDSAAALKISGRLREWRMRSFSVRTAYGVDGPAAMRRLNDKIQKRVT
jgi:hypothetical protein